MTEKRTVDPKELFRRIATGALVDEQIANLRAACFLTPNPNSFDEALEQAFAGLGIDVLSFMQQAPLLFEPPVDVPVKENQETAEAAVSLIQRWTSTTTDLLLNEVNRPDFNGVVEGGLTAFLDDLLLEVTERGFRVPAMLGVLENIRENPGITLRGEELDSVQGMPI